MIFHFLPKMKMILGQYTHSGIRVWPKLTENDEFEKRSVSLKNSNPGSKADFWKRSKFGVW